MPVSYVPEFVAKSESLTRSIPRSFLVRSLLDFAAGLDDDLLLCPVRALRIYLDRTLSLAPTRRRLFVSPSCPTRAMSKNAVSFMGLRRPILRWVRSVPMTFVVSLPWWRSTATGRSPRCLTRPPGAPVRCLPPFNCATFSMSFRVFARWVRLWLRVRGSRSPHLFPLCSGGRGDSMSSLSPLLRGSITCFSYSLWWPALPVPVQVLGYPVLCFYFHFYCVYSLCFFSLFFMRVPA